MEIRNHLLSVGLVGETIIIIQALKVHKREKFFGSDFEFFTIL
jgi:hypothetical protein